MSEDRLGLATPVTGGRTVPLALLVLIAMLGPLTLNILLPSLPGLAPALETTRERAQLVLSLYLVGMAISQLVLGPLADALGRRPVLIGGIGLYVLASIGAVLAESIEMLVAMRLLQAFGGTTGIALGRAVIRDVYSRSAAASMIGYVTMAMVVAPMLAPTIGAELDEGFGWRSIFVFCAGFGAVALVLTGLLLPETRPAGVSASARAVAARSFDLLKSPRFLGYAGTSTAASAMFFMFVGAVPHLVIEVMQVPKSVYAQWFILSAFGYMVGNFVSGRTVQRVSIDRLIVIGNVFGLLAALAILALASAGISHPSALFVPAFLFTFGNGMVMPNAIAGALSVDPRAAGAASGLTGFMQMGVGALASFLAATIVDQTAVPLGLGMLGFALLAILTARSARTAPRDATESKA